MADATRAECMALAVHLDEATQPQLDSTRYVGTEELIAEIEDDARKDARAKVLNEFVLRAPSMCVRSEVGAGREAPPSFPYWVERLVERLRKEGGERG